MPITRRRLLPSIAVLACGARVAADPLVPAGVSDGVWQATIEPGADVVALRVRRHGATSQEIVNTRFLPNAVARPGGEWRVTGLTLNRQTLAVVLTLTPRPGPGGASEKAFEFDLSRPDAPLVRFASIDRRGGRYDVFRYDLAAREARRCVDQATPDVRSCPPVVESMRPARDVGDVGLASMPSAEDYAPPTQSITLHGAPIETPVPLPKPGR